MKTPEDLTGKKIRVQESDLHIAMAEAMGASATPMAFGEVYTALQSGVVDAAENNEVSYFTQKHYEVAPYFSYTNHLIGTDYLIINSDLLQAMSEEDRAAFDKEWTATYEEHTELWTRPPRRRSPTPRPAARPSPRSTATLRRLTAADEFITTDAQQTLSTSARELARARGDPAPASAPRAVPRTRRASEAT